LPICSLATSLSLVSFPTRRSSDLLIARPSVTPDDAGCQAMIAGRLQRAGFACEHLRYGEVDNLWATHGSGEGPVLVLLGHTDVVDRKSTRLNSSHVKISYAVFCLK